MNSDTLIDSSLIKFLNFINGENINSMRWNQKEDHRDEGPWGKKESHSKKNEEKSILIELMKYCEFLSPQQQEKIRNFLSPKKTQSFVMLFLSIFIAGIWLSSGFYRVQPNEQGLVLRFGKAARTAAQPGLNYHLPYPIEQVIIRDVTAVNRIDSGTKELNSTNNNTNADVSTLMLTGDENVLDTHFTVLWVIKDLSRYLFSAKSPDITVKSAAESVVREVLAQTPIVSALTKGRSVMNQHAQSSLQALLDEYKLGIHVQEVLLGRIDPPLPTLDSFRDVQRAKADMERSRNNGEAYRNSKIPLAKGEAQTIIQGAIGSSKKKVALSQGNIRRFEALSEQYLLAPEIVSRRLYLETMEHILKDAPKTILSEGSEKSTVPYLKIKKSKTPLEKN